MIYFVGDLSTYLSYSLVLLVIFVFWLDWLDGYIARRSGKSTDIGSMIDITCDRGVEVILAFGLAYRSAISPLIPLLLLIRGYLTDSLRWYSMKAHKRPFKGLHKKGSLFEFLTSSRITRGLYGGIKLLFFTLGAAYVFVGIVGLREVVYYLGWLVILLNILRGIPAFHDGLLTAEKLVERY